MISRYLERLARELDFDPSLSRQVVQEVEDHLQETVERDPAADRPEAERRAVAKFGDPRVIAAQFAVVSLAALARRNGLAAVLLIAAVFIAMQARLTWYGVVPLPLAAEAKALGEVVLAVDRWAFWVAVLAGLAGWVYIGRRLPGGFTREYSARLRRFSLLCSAAAAALVVCVAADGVLTSLRLIGAHWSIASLVPLISVAFEIACAAVLVSRSRAMARRAARTTSLA
jgi:hypothetical protein